MPNITFEIEERFMERLERVFPNVQDVARRALLRALGEAEFQAMKNEAEAALKGRVEELNKDLGL